MASRTDVTDTEERPAFNKLEFVGEFLGTGLLVGLGDAVVATVLMQDDLSNAMGKPVPSRILYINFGWAAAVGFAVLCSFDASGAHLNTAVTVSAMVQQKMTVTKGLIFIAAQMLGAITGATLVSIYFMTRKDIELANFFYTAPAPGVGMPAAFCAEVLCTWLLLLGIGFVANGTPKPNKLLMACAVGFLVFTIGTCMGQLTGYAMNPARDLGPRLVSAVWHAIYEKDLLSPFEDGYFLIPIVAPLVGGILGSVTHGMTKKPDLIAPAEGPSTELTA